MGWKCSYDLYSDEPINRPRHKYNKENTKGSYQPTVLARNE